MGKIVVAKFQCGAVTDYGDGGKNINLYAATTGEENKTWAKYTPGGSINMSIDNPDASALFENGKYYRVTFELFDPEPTKVDAENLPVDVSQKVPTGGDTIE